MKFTLPNTGANKSLSGLVVIYCYSGSTATSSLNFDQQQNPESSWFAAFYNMHSLWQPYYSNGQIFSPSSNTAMWPDLQYSQSSCLFFHFLPVRSYSPMFFIQMGQIGTEDIGKKDNLIFKDKHILKNKQTKKHSKKHHLDVCAQHTFISTYTFKSDINKMTGIFSPYLSVYFTEPSMKMHRLNGHVDTISFPLKCGEIFTWSYTVIGVGRKKNVSSGFQEVLRTSKSQ